MTKFLHNMKDFTNYPRFTYIDANKDMLHNYLYISLMYLFMNTMSQNIWFVQGCNCLVMPNYVNVHKILNKLSCHFKKLVVNID